MSDQGGSCTLIFYKIGDAFWNEPFLNLLAAAAQLSTFTHVELAIGNAAGSFGRMSNVARIFNDDAGVSIVLGYLFLVYPAHTFLFRAGGTNFKDWAEPTGTFAKL